jgi:hypothetical protein
MLMLSYSVSAVRMPPPELIQSFCSLTLHHDTKIAKISSEHGQVGIEREMEMK